jgi:hypothetical protein
MIVPQFRTLKRCLPARSSNIFTKRQAPRPRGKYCTDRPQQVHSQHASAPPEMHSSRWRSNSHHGASKMQQPESCNRRPTVRSCENYVRILGCFDQQFMMWLIALGAWPGFHASSFMRITTSHALPSLPGLISALSMETFPRRPFPRSLKNCRCTNLSLSENSGAFQGF